jgi:poly(A) polymerase
MRAPKKGETGLVVVPPPEIRNEINMWRRVFKAYTSQITPHITIIFPFVPDAVWAGKRSDVVKALKNIHPFRIKMRELGSFIHDESVLWLKPESGRNLKRIHSRMHEIFAVQISPSTLAYVPHLTLGSFNRVEDLLGARAIVQKRLKPLQFTVDRIIYAIFEEEGWRIHDHIQLE